MTDWDKKIPKIKGVEAIIDKTENPDHILYEKKPVKIVEKAVKKPKSSKNSEKRTKEGDKETKWRPNGDQVATKKKPSVRERVTFTPNKYIKQLMKEIEVKYGSTGKSEFINVAIEAEYNRRK